MLDKSTDPITLALRSLQDQGAMVCAVETFCGSAAEMGAGLMECLGDIIWDVPSRVVSVGQS